MARKNKVGALMVLGVAVLLLFGSILPASAAGPAGVLIFRGVATSANICYPGTKTLNPSATGPCAPDFINNADIRDWSLDVGLGADGALDFCVGANSTGAVGVKTYSGPSAGAFCDLKGSGKVKAGPAYEDAAATSPVRVGPYCGASHGTGNNESVLGATSTKEQVEWIQSAATVLPTVDGDLNNTELDRDTDGNGTLDSADKVLIAGVTDAIGSIGGNCGITGASVKFNVVGVAVGIGQ